MPLTTPSSERAERQEFRAYCRDWLANNHPGRPPVPLPLSQLLIDDPRAVEWLQGWQKSAYDAGLVGCDYPVEYGGGGRTDCQAIANEEMHAAKMPYLVNIVGMGMAGPTILFHGNEDVKRELLPPLLSAEHIWCQGFSEPGAGSDLANQQTFARRDGDHWIVNGHKVWTSLAHFADWMILLCRTDRGDKYGGLSYFVVPINAALGNGVTVRPLIKMTGETGFNQVLFDDLVVPDRYRLGAVGEGWKVAMTTLTHERGAAALVNPASGGMPLEEEGGVTTSSVSSLVDLARSQPRGDGTAADDAGIRDELVQLMIRQEAQKQNVRRARVPALTDHPTRLPLQGKVTGSELTQDIGALACRIEGMGSTLAVTDERAPAGGLYPLAYMNSFGGTIAAGTSEIQRNILGERVLGLAKSK
ncbi:MAG: acyl-CoA dehydrogenase [Gammaproteobacteria bacterium]|nr:acyl-CoA dehydrogenase [Gammaproteobacteria bacterium]